MGKDLSLLAEVHRTPGNDHDTMFKASVCGQWKSKLTQYPGFPYRPGEDAASDSGLRLHGRLRKGGFSVAAGFCYLTDQASVGELVGQLCFSKSSCATRLNASAATVLSRRGAVRPHSQWEQHQPANASSSIQIRHLGAGALIISCPLSRQHSPKTRGKQEEIDSRFGA